MIKILFTVEVLWVLSRGFSQNARSRISAAKNASAIRREIACPANFGRLMNDDYLRLNKFQRTH